MKINWAIVIAISALLVSCKAMKGELDVHEKITLLKKKSVFSSKLKKVDIEIGKYKGKLKASSKEKFKLSLKDVVDGKDATFIFKIPKDTEIPTSQGELVITAE
jgi:hypothetical protein